MEKLRKRYAYQYPHPAVATDCVVLGFDGKEINVLLVERGVEPYRGRWAFQGGFLKMDETVEECALRELREETGLNLSFLKQVKVFSAVRRDPRERVLSVAFYALVRHSEVRAGDDAAKAKWFPVNEVQDMDLAFDHNMIFEEVMKCIRKDIRFEPIGFDLLDRSFTIPQLQLLYERILDTKFDRRNFQKKVMQLGIVEPADETESSEPLTPMEEKRGRAKGRFMSAMFGNANYAETAPEADVCMESSADCYNGTAYNDVTPQASGRKARKYRFNKRNYDKLKDDESFKLEF